MGKNNEHEDNNEKNHEPANDNDHNEDLALENLKEDEELMKIHDSKPPSPLEHIKTPRDLVASKIDKSPEQNLILKSKTPEQNGARKSKTPQIVNSKSPMNSTRYALDQTDKTQQTNPNNNSKKFYATASAINNLKTYKNKKKIEQSVKDMEDTIVRDTIQDRKLVSSFDKPIKNATPKLDNKLNKSAELGINAYVNRDGPYNDLMKEYSALKLQENNVLDEIYGVNSEFKQKPIISNNKENESIDFLSLFDNNSNLADFDNNNDSFGLSTIDSNDKNISNLKKLQIKTIAVEKQRRDFQFKLEGFQNSKSYALPYKSNENINLILKDLKEKQKINESALLMLKQRLTNSKNTTTTDNMNRNLSTKDQVNPLRGSYRSLKVNPYNPYLNDINDIDDDFSQLGTNGSSFSADEIRAMRLNYLSNGGHDQTVLNRFTEMEYNARFKNGNNSVLNGNITNRNSDFYDPVTLELDSKIRKVDMENKRLQAELELLQEKYETLSNSRSAPSFQATMNKQNDFTLPPINQPFTQVNGVASRGAPRSNIPNQFQPQDFSNNYKTLSNSRGKLSQTSYNNEEEIPRTSYRSLSNQASKAVKLKDLPPSVYDPTSGFVIFIDFVTNLDPTYASARVITCLHHPKSGLGEPSVLPIVNCESYNDLGRTTSVALVSTKQPVPRCPPQQALSILIELQMTVRDNRETKLKSCAWTKIPLFDSQNRLLSGRWRSALKNLPIKSDANLSYIDSLPDFGRSDLYYRLVNLRDSDEQTNAPISPAYADQYTDVNNFQQ